MKAVYLSIGSNVDPAKHIPAAMELLKLTFPTARFSSVYETEPVGPAGKEKFWNLAAVIHSGDTKEILVQKLREIETAQGRVRSGNKYAPRTLDIDILPQEDYQNQAFIMIPLAEIAPQEKDPLTGKSFKDLAERMQEEGKKFRKV